MNCLFSIYITVNILALKPMGTQEETQLNNVEVKDNNILSMKVNSFQNSILFAITALRILIIPDRYRILFNTRPVFFLMEDTCSPPRSIALKHIPRQTNPNISIQSDHSANTLILRLFE